MIRPYAPSDLSALHQINAAATPGVSAESEDSLGDILALAECLVAIGEAGAPLGFISLVEPGTAAYDSKNLRWFERWIAETREDLIYVDRIALSPAARGKGLGAKLYEAAFEAHAHRGLMGCEVNDDPPNPASHAFHGKLGFARIGAARYSPDYAVAYYTRRLGA